MNAYAFEGFVDPYCYKGSTCLRNRLSIRDADELERVEHQAASLRAQQALPGGRWDCARYRRLHRHLFGDIYAWAGRYRTIRIAKAKHVFCYPEFIAAQMDDLFAGLAAECFLQGSSRVAFIAAMAAFLAELNAIHPFREGNGRTQLSFTHALCTRAGHPVALAALRTTPFFEAMVDSFAGDLAPLQSELSYVLV